MKDGSYLQVSFSNSGRYMTAIREESTYTSLEIYDFYRSEGYDENITIRFSSSGSPGYVCFSP